MAKIGCVINCAVIKTAGEKVSIEIRKDKQIVGKLHGAVFKGQSILMIG